MGEYRGIMNLCRVLPNGGDAKAAVDAAVERCAGIGNLRADIHACKEAAEGGMTGEEEGASSLYVLCFWLPLLCATCMSCMLRLFFGRVLAQASLLNAPPPRPSPSLACAATSPVGGAVVQLGEPRAAAAAAARRLGLHYLQRYFFLIAFR